MLKIIQMSVFPQSQITVTRLPTSVIRLKGLFTWGAQKIVVSHETIVLITEIVDKLIEGLLSAQAVQLPSAL